MSKNFIKRNIQLTLEFDSYLLKKPELFDQIPNKSGIVMTVKGDYYYNRLSRSMAKASAPHIKQIVEARKEGTKWRIVNPAFS